MKAKETDRTYFVAFNHGLAYNELNKLSCTEPFRLIAYARKNSKRLLCGLFLWAQKPMWRLRWE